MCYLHICSNNRSVYGPRSICNFLENLVTLELPISREDKGHLRPMFRINKPGFRVYPFSTDGGNFHPSINAHPQTETLRERIVPRRLGSGTLRSVSELEALRSRPSHFESFTKDIQLLKASFDDHKIEIQIYIFCFFWNFSSVCGKREVSLAIFDVFSFKA